MKKSSLNTILVIGIATLSVLNLGAGTAKAGSTVWDKDWTALTVSRTGAWGTRTSPSRFEAMIGAMADCRENAGVSGSGCGSRITTVRAGWSAAYACGTETFIVTEASLGEIRAAAINREIELREIERVEIGQCQRLIVIGPDGEAATPQMLSEVLPLLPEQPEIAASEQMH
jgi:hypothetical protein